MNNNNFCILSDKFQRVTDKNSVGNTNVLTISAQHGLINQFEYYNHQYASENTSGYTLLHKGDFAYNKSYSDGYPWGATKRLERYDSGVVSPLYICFAAKDGVCADFYSYYFESEPFYREIYKIAQEGARNHGLLNVATEDFFKIRIANPPLEEQRRIADIWGCCDRVIALKKELIAEKKKQKKSLMQKLLNPDSGFSSEISKVRFNRICRFINGRAYSQGELLESGKYRVLRVGNLFTSEEWYYSDLELSVDKYCQKGDLLYAWSASFGPFIWQEEKTIYHYHIWKVEPFLNIDKMFLYHCLRHDAELLQNTIQGGTMSHITKETMEHRLCPFIDNLIQQKNIADILSAAEKEIDLLEQELAQQEQKKKSLMQLLLTGIVRG